MQHKCCDAISYLNQKVFIGRAQRPRWPVHARYQALGRRFLRPGPLLRARLFSRPKRLPPRRAASRIRSPAATPPAPPPPRPRRSAPSPRGRLCPRHRGRACRRSVHEGPAARVRSSQPPEKRRWAKQRRDNGEGGIGFHGRADSGLPQRPQQRLGQRGRRPEPRIDRGAAAVRLHRTKYRTAQAHSSKCSPSEFARLVRKAVA